MGASAAQPKNTHTWSSKTTDLIAPCGHVNAWEGAIAKKPSEYNITAVVPHLNTPEILGTCVQLLNLQTEKPYILIVDTGSSDETCAIIESLRAENVEIHYIKSHSWRHPSEPVSAAQDLALILCKTKYMFCTHADCFLKKQTLLSEWLDLMSKYSVVGYRISPRTYPGWVHEFGHAALLS